jgi:hypothetical protein
VSVDPRTKYFKRLRRLRRSARGWTVRAGILTGAAAVLVPYHGLGLWDAFWAAAAGGSATLAALRWSDHKALAAQPAPAALPPAPALAVPGAVEAIMRRFPAGQSALDELRKTRDRVRLRGSSVLPAWQRLEKASGALAGLAGRLGGGPAESAVLEAAVAEHALRELAERAASVERAIRLAPDDTLLASHAALVAQLEEGVTAYERLVAAAAGYVAEDGRPATEHVAITRVREATDLLRGIAAGLSELRTAGPTMP